MFAVHETGGTSRASTLRSWAGRPLEHESAFHSLYLGSEDGDGAGTVDDGEAHRVASPFLLNPAQAAAVRSSRRQPVTLISGAPGTGKSHTIAAVACDALGRGETVLVAAKSDATVDALVDLLERSPGAQPVVFGSNERREVLAARLSAGHLQPVSDAGIEQATNRLRDALATRDRQRAACVELLDAEAMLDTPEDEVEVGRRLTPALFEPDTDLEQVAALAEAATMPAGGWWARRRRRKAERRLRQLSGAAADADLAMVVSLLPVPWPLGALANWWRPAASSSATDGNGSAWLRTRPAPRSGAGSRRTAVPRSG